MILSANEYRAQKLAAQYEWVRPRLKGNKRPASWGNWFIATKGPNDAAKTAITLKPNAKKLRGLNAEIHDRAII
jgi:hypothetical protein